MPDIRYQILYQIVELKLLLGWVKEKIISFSKYMYDVPITKYKGEITKTI